MPQDLLAYISVDIVESIVSHVRALAETLSHRADWSISPPLFVDELDETSCTAPGDEPVRTVGLLLKVARPEESPPTPVSEVERFVEALAKFSTDHEVEFELQIDTTYVGTVAHGLPDRLVREGLLATWESSRTVHGNE